MADEENKSIFRKKSEEYIDSPEKLDEYLHVTNPGIWAVLAAVIVLLIGVLVWGIVARLDTQMQVAVVAQNGEAVCLVPQSALNAVVNNKTATLESGETISLAPDALEPVMISSETNIYLILAGGFSAGDIVYEIPVTTALSDGIYTANVKTESLSPLKLLLN